MRELRDQTGVMVRVPDYPQRIVSLVPSQTELLIHLGLGKRLVGRTKFCVHPPSVKDIPIVGGTKNYRYAAIADLKPDLIIGNLEENEKEGIETLRKDYPVWLSDIKSIEDALEMIRELGEIVELQDQAKEITNSIKAEFERFKSRKKLKTVYMIWKDPWMAAGTDTFINEMMSLSGFANLIKDPRYPEISIPDLFNLEPEVIMLSSEPYPFKEQHIVELREKMPEVRVILVDGEMFSWYGSRLLKAVDYLQELHELLDD